MCKLDCLLCSGAFHDFASHAEKTNKQTNRVLPISSPTSLLPSLSQLSPPPSLATARRLGGFLPGPLPVLCLPRHGASPPPPPRSHRLTPSLLSGTCTGAIPTRETFPNNFTRNRNPSLIPSPTLFSCLLFSSPKWSGCSVRAGTCFLFAIGFSVLRAVPGTLSRERFIMWKIELSEITWEIAS